MNLIDELPMGKKYMLYKTSLCNGRFVVIISV